MSELPKGWVEVTLGELCDLNLKHSKDINDDIKVSFVPMAAVSDIEGRITSHESKSFGSVRKGYTHFQNDDVLFAKITPCMENGKSAIAKDLLNGIGCGSTEFFVFRSKGAVVPEYFHRFIRQISFRKNARRNMAGAVGHARVPKDHMLSSALPLPPLKEQRRIVAKLESCEARISVAREAMDDLPKLLQQYRQSVLAAAFRGDLTRDWRAAHPDVEPAEHLLARLRIERRERWQQNELAKYQEKGKNPPKNWQQKYKEPEPLSEEQLADLPEIPEGWCWGRMNEVVAGLRYGSSTKSLKKGDVPVLRMGNLQNGAIDWDSLVYSSDQSEIDKYALPKKAVLFNRTNSPELVGKTAIYRGEKQAIFAGYLIHVDCLPSYEPEYMNFVLNSPRAKSWCWQVKSDGVSQSNISAGKLSQFVVPVCSLVEQRALIKIVTKLLGFERMLQSVSDETASDLSSLTQSLLAKAFRGELIPQDPSDEPASDLLSRLKEQRAKNKKPANKKK